MSKKEDKKNVKTKEKAKTQKPLSEQAEPVGENKQPNREQKLKKTKKAHPTDLGNHGYNGGRLKKARLDKGLTLEAVHDVTKIPLDVLRAIEEGYNLRTISEFYLKGFIKIYSNYLNVDVKEIVSDYKPEKLPKYIKHEVDDSPVIRKYLHQLTRKQKQQVVIALIAFVGLFLFYRILISIKNFIFRPRPPKPQVIKVVNDKTGSELVKTSAQDKDNKTKSDNTKVSPPSQKEKPKPKPNPEPNPQPKPVPKSQAKPTTSVQPVPTKTTPVVKKNIVLTVRAKKSSWLRVEADGNVVFQSTLRSGAVETWLANDKIIISGKNINQLEFELNGKMIGALGRGDSRAKKVVITKDGLAVTR